MSDKHTDMTVAKTILEQLGGNKFRMMTGAKNLLHYYELPYEVEAHGREYGLLVGFLLVWTDLEKKFEKELNNLV